MLADGPTVYAGGYFVNAGGYNRPYVAAIDSATSLATSWNPSADSKVATLVLDDPAIYAGGEFTVIGGRQVKGLARLYPLPTGPPVVAVLSPNGGEVAVIGTTLRVTWSALAAAPGIQSVDLYVSRAGPSGPWELIAAGVPNTGARDWQVVGPASVGSCYVRVDARDWAGNVGTDASDAGFSIVVTTTGVEPPAGAVALALAPITPNPLQGAARLSYSLSRRAVVRLLLLDLQGRVVRRLVDGECVAGAHDATLEVGGLAPGLYLVRLQAPGAELSRKVVLVR
jgi:hypothetical protein